MISVIVPVYNIENYISRCLNSILGQTYRDMEIVCTDDGSADKSANVLDEFAKNNPNIIVIHKKNAGVTNARIDGINLAQGENIGFCDGDDEIESDMYERLYNNKVKYNADISHCGHKVVSLDGSVKYYYNTGRLAQQDREEGLKDLLAGSFEPGLWSKLYSKTLLHSLLHSGACDTDIKLNEDLLMNYYIFKIASKTVYEDFCPYKYLKREGSASVSKNIRFLTDPIRVREIILDDIDSNNKMLFIPAIVSFIRISISMYMYCLMHGSEIENVNMFKGKFRKNINENKKYIRHLNIGGQLHAYMLLYAPALSKMVFRNY